MSQIHSSVHWDKRITCFLCHHYGPSRHLCDARDAVLATHSFLTAENHKLVVRRNTVEVFHSDGSHWFSQEYFMAPTSACKECGGRGYPAREDGWARLCHVCAKDKVLLHPSCGPDGSAARFTTVVVDK